jgi:flagellar assembly factor FliW
MSTGHPVMMVMIVMVEITATTVNMRVPVIFVKKKAAADMVCFACMLLDEIMK